MKRHFCDICDKPALDGSVLLHDQFFGARPPNSWSGARRKLFARFSVVEVEKRQGCSDTSDATLDIDICAWCRLDLLKKLVDQAQVVIDKLTPKTPHIVPTDAFGGTAVLSEEMPSCVEVKPPAPPAPPPLYIAPRPFSTSDADNTF